MLSLVETSALEKKQWKRKEMLGGKDINVEIAKMHCPEKTS